MKLTVTNLQKSYGAHSILRDVNLSLQGVGAVGIIGESGCGKSTLLRLLSGIEDPDEGEVCINEYSPITQKKRFQETIGVVFQRHQLFPHLTLRQNITLLLHEIQKQPKEAAEAKAAALLAQLHLEGQEDKRPDQVSGGQAQRASIARALASDPQLIFLDEPTAALDPVLTDEVLKAVKELKQEGRDFIFVTHELAFLKEFADYVVFMKEGEICEQGAVACLTAPKTPELAAFVGANIAAQQ